MAQSDPELSILFFWTDSHPVAHCRCAKGTWTMVLDCTARYSTSGKEKKKKTLFKKTTFCLFRSGNNDQRGNKFPNAWSVAEVTENVGTHRSVTSTSISVFHGQHAAAANWRLNTRGSLRGYLHRRCLDTAAHGWGWNINLPLLPPCSGILNERVLIQPSLALSSFFSSLIPLPSSLSSFLFLKFPFESISCVLTCL